MTTTLLAVDDSATMRRVLEITFAGENFKTILASSAEEAMTVAKTEHPAFAIVDHTLPDMSGYDLCRRLKGAVPGMAVLMLASKQSAYDKARGAATGVDDFMDKPFDTQKLLDKVHQVLSQPRAAPAGATAPVMPPAPQEEALLVATARPRSQTLSYGSPTAPLVSPSSPVSHFGGVPRTHAGAPGPGSAASPAAPQPAPAAPASTRAGAAVAAAVGSARNGLGGKLEAMGLTPSQVEGVLALSREVVERVVWEVVPVLAETLIKEELARLTAD